MDISINIWGKSGGTGQVYAQSSISIKLAGEEDQGASHAG